MVPLCGTISLISVLVVGLDMQEGHELLPEWRAAALVSSKADEFEDEDEDAAKAWIIRPSDEVRKAVGDDANELQRRQMNAISLFSSRRRKSTAATWRDSENTTHSLDQKKKKKNDEDEILHEFQKRQSKWACAEVPVIDFSRLRGKSTHPGDVTGLVDFGLLLSVGLQPFEGLHVVVVSCTALLFVLSFHALL